MYKKITHTKTTELNLEEEKMLVFFYFVHPMKYKQGNTIRLFIYYYYYY